MKWISILLVVLVIAFALGAGCAAKKEGMPQRPDPTPTGITYYVNPPTTPVPAETQFKASTTIVQGKEVPYLRSVARGYVPQPAGFVCTQPEGYLGGPDGVIGVFCEH